MIISINLEKCIEHNVNPIVACLLSEIHHTKNFTKGFYTPDWLLFVEVNNYLLSKDPFILSEKALDLIGLKGDVISAKEFINIFPSKVRADVGHRVIRPISETSLGYKKLENDYLEKVLTKKEHDLICKNAKIFVKSELLKNNGYYIPTLTNIIAHTKWDYWDGLDNPNNSPTTQDIYDSV